MSGRRQHVVPRRGVALALAIAASIGCAAPLSSCGPGERACTSEADCPEEEGSDPCVESRCDVDRGVCADRRADRDRDGHAPIACASTRVTGAPADDCDDTRASASPTATEQCNAVDDDCDGETDEEPDATRACPESPHTTRACAAGRCEIAACDEGYDDCNERPSDGCETSTLTDPRSCGACGVECPTTAGGTTCVAGACACPGVRPAVCDGRCVDTASSGTSCGACGVVCPLFAGFACIDGACACPEGRIDCGGACRDTTSDVAACGACGNACATGQTCESGRCTGSIVALSLGRRHACALRGNGRVVCWGSNDLGQLGNGTLDASSRPRPVSDLADAAQLVAGGDHTCVRTRRGTILCWGGGDGVIIPGRDIGAQTLPRLVEVETPAGLSDVDVGDGLVAATDGIMLVRWDGSSRDTVAMALESVQLELGAEHGCVLETRPGPVACWGANDAGQLGRASFDPVSDPMAARVTGLGSATAVATGDDTTCALIDGGRVRCWGNGRHTPGRVDEREDGSLVELREAVAVTSTGSHACVLRTTGDVACWGDDDRGQLGRDLESTGTTWAEPVVGLSGASAVEAGGATTCALTRSGEVYCWGANDEGQVGDGSTRDRARPTLVVDL